jgi:uncharacterized protein DUF6959
MKKSVTLDVLCEESNFVVLKMPSRAYPGVLIQGDSLMSIIGELEEAKELFESDREESMGCVENALDELQWRMNGYWKVCRENGIK